MRRKVPRRRRTPGEARTEALASARRLLLSEGPDALTLQRVAAEIGMTHSNLLHHFGSAAELQTALMAAMVRDLTDALGKAVAHVKSEGAAPRVLIDTVFDAFDEGGAGRLAAWIALAERLPQLDAIQSAIDALVAALEERFGAALHASRADVTSAVLFVALIAFGDAVIGEPLRTMLSRRRGDTRDVATFLLTRLFEGRR